MLRPRLCLEVGADGVGQQRLLACGERWNAFGVPSADEFQPGCVHDAGVSAAK
jgi:hypothetical protein